MAELKKFPMIVRVIGAIVSGLIGLTILFRLIYLKNYNLEFGLIAMIFGFLFLGFIAVKGTDPISYLQHITSGKKDA